jgi:hypothetical protein
MAIKIQSQKDYLLTEACIDVPCDLNDLDCLMRTMKATGKITATYSGGGLYGVSLEQKTRIRESVADEVREIVGVKTKEVNGYGEQKG